MPIGIWYVTCRQLEEKNKRLCSRKRQQYFYKRFPTNKINNIFLKKCFFGNRYTQKKYCIFKNIPPDNQIFNFLFFKKNYAELTLLDHEYEWLVVVGVEVCALDGGLLLLADPLPLRVQKLDLHVRIWKRSNMHDYVVRFPINVAFLFMHGGGQCGKSLWCTRPNY